MRIFCLVGCLVWSVSCDSEQIYTVQDMQDAVVGNSSEAVVWRYTVVMDRLLQRDFDATEITKPQFVKRFSQKAMELVNQQLTKNLSTAIKVGTILTTLKGQFPAGSPEAQGLGKIVDAATALGLNTDKSQNKQLSDNMNKAIIDFFSDANLRQALADKGGFISSRLKGPPDLVAEVLNREFINAVLAIQETSQLQRVVDIPTMFAEFNKTMHIVLNDKELMIAMTDPTIVNAVGAVLQAFFKLYDDLRANKDNHDVNTIKARVATMFNSFNDQRRTVANTLSAALWNAAYPVQFKNLKHTDACSSNQWQAVQDLDGNSLVANLPEAALTLLSLCRVSAASCDAWGAWLPLADTVCAGETLTQTRIRSRTCPVPCTGNDCSPTETETQDVDGTKVCAPTCASSCQQACTKWEVWESKAWSPSTDTVCGGQRMQQRKSRAQRRTCANLCENTDCNIFEILPAGKRTVEGTGDCDTTLPPTCKCCDSQNREITSCPTDSRLTWDTATCSCGNCSKETIIFCGGIYTSGKLHNDRALDENCACYYKTRKQSWARAIVYGDRKGKELLDTDCALQNVDAFKDSGKGRDIRTALWDDGCIDQSSFAMGCNASKDPKPHKVRQNFIDFHDRTRTRQTKDGYWGLGTCIQVFKQRQDFERRMMKTILTCGDHSYSLAAWEQIGKPPHFDRIYKRTPSTFLEGKIPEWGQHLKICESEYQRNRPNRINVND